MQQSQAAHPKVPHGDEGLARSTLTVLLGLDGASYLTLVVGTKDKAIYTRSKDLV
jgi:hypothetical protein